MIFLLFWVSNLNGKILDSLFLFSWVGKYFSGEIITCKLQRDGKKTLAPIESIFKWQICNINNPWIYFIYSVEGGKIIDYLNCQQQFPISFLLECSCVTLSDCPLITQISFIAKLYRSIQMRLLGIPAVCICLPCITQNLWDVFISVGYFCQWIQSTLWSPCVPLIQTLYFSYVNIFFITNLIQYITF